jgi:arylsulfatase A-like enzyme
MGYRTPNIDRFAAEGAIFTDSYGQQSCTAGRASFILGQEPFCCGEGLHRSPAPGCRLSPRRRASPNFLKK